MKANVIFNNFPNAIEINGNKYEIKTDFHEWIKFDVLIHSISSNNFIVAVHDLLFNQIPIDIVIQNYQSVFKDIISFYTLGQSDNAQYQTKSKEEETKSNKKRLYDFNQDSVYIYSAFRECYNIDLSESNMHWWKFKALFDGLNENTKIMQIISIRATDTAKIKSKSEKNRILKLQKMYKIEEEKSPEIIEQEFNEGFVDCFI